MVNSENSNQLKPPKSRAARCLRRTVACAGWLLPAVALGCQAISNAKATGGVSVDASAGCPAGVAAVLGDSSYSSSQVALLSLSGNVLSESFISTASTRTDGLAFALSGDVVLPTNAPASGRVVILDRYGTNVVTWIDTTTAQVQAQLQVGTGFESNPQDYFEVANGRALVSRWGVNDDPGVQPFDAGSDVLVVGDQGDGMATVGIESRVAIPLEGNLPPRPTSFTSIGNSIAVVLQRYSEDFATVGDAQVVRLDLSSLQIVQTLSLSGVSNCGRLMPVPGTSNYAIACTGPLNFNGSSTDLSHSALVLLELDRQGDLTEQSRWLAADIAQEPLQHDVDFANEHIALVKTQTGLQGTTNNRLLAVNLDDNSITELAQARQSADGTGKGAMFGTVVCSPNCSSLCLMADSDQAVVRRFDFSAGSPVELAPVTITPNVPLYPRQLAYFGGAQ